MTTPAVASEARSEAASARLRQSGAAIVAPSTGSLKKTADLVSEAGGKTSAADSSLVALALDTKGAVFTDDYALQNLCLVAGVQFEPMLRAGITEERRFRPVCLGCGGECQKEGVCTVCGHEIRLRKG